MTLKNPFKNEIVSSVLKALTEFFSVLRKDHGLTPKDIFQLLTIPPDFLLGQAALPCFLFSKILKTGPQQIAIQLAERLNQEALIYIDKVTPVGGYLNFHCQFSSLAENFASSLQSGDFFTGPFLESSEIEKVLVEYSQPNTHKIIHVGHLRCLVLGDAICNLLEYVGHRVVRTTYPGDFGTHIGKIIWYLTHPAPKKLPTQNKAEWLGRMYVEADEHLKALQGTPEEVKAKNQISEILSQISSQNGNYYDLWQMTREWSLEELRRIYSWLGSRFDIWFFESECEKPSRELVEKKLQEGFFVQDQGAVGIDLTSWNLGFALYLKSDGQGLYLTKDLDLITKKFSDPEVTSSIVVVDSRQKLHFQQLFKTAELMGYPQALKSFHLAYETVNTEDGKVFSSREMNGLSLNELRNRMEEKVIQDYLRRYAEEWSAQDIQFTAEKITISALKYGMLRFDNTTQIRFSINEWLRLDGETGPYLQYVYARCCRILDKNAKHSSLHETGLPSFKVLLQDNCEKELLFLLTCFNESVIEATKKFRPCLLTHYLYITSKAFNRFYESCPIQGTSEDLQRSRLLLVRGTSEVIARGLQLLGIPVVKKM